MLATDEQLDGMAGSLELVVAPEVSSIVLNVFDVIFVGVEKLSLVGAGAVIASKQPAGVELLHPPPNGDGAATLLGFEDPPPGRGLLAETK